MTALSPESELSSKRGKAIETSKQRQLLQGLKAAAASRGPLPGLPVGRPAEAFLRPVITQRELLNWADVRVLSEWRNRFGKAFLTEFEADDERTARWLTEVVGPDDTRILFMVDDTERGETVGYMGLAFIDWERHTAEADAIVKGGISQPGLMKRALLTMLRWARNEIGLQTLSVRVRSDNSALEFYQKVGFVEVRRAPLRRLDKPDMVQWVEDESLPPGEPSLIHMVLKAGVLEEPNHHHIQAAPKSIRKEV